MRDISIGVREAGTPDKVLDNNQSPQNNMLSPPTINDVKQLDDLADVGLPKPDESSGAESAERFTKVSSSHKP